MKDFAKIVLVLFCLSMTRASLTAKTAHGMEARWQILADEGDVGHGGDDTASGGSGSWVEEGDLVEEGEEEEEEEEVESNEAETEEEEMKNAGKESTDDQLDGEKIIQQEEVKQDQRN